MTALGGLTIEWAAYLRGRRLVDKPDIRSVCSLLDYSYAVLVDGHVGMSGLIEVKKSIDASLRKAYPLRDLWGIDADEVDEVPSVVDAEVDPEQDARWVAEQARRAAHRSAEGGGLG